MYKYFQSSILFYFSFYQVPAKYHPTFQIDVKNLRNLFAQLQFKVEHKKNLKRHEFDRELLAFANDPGHRESDMMILAILSHGREGNVFASDGTVIAIESIYEKFNNKNCPALQGKPKFFIIQVGGLKSILEETKVGGPTLSTSTYFKL